MANAPDNGILSQYGLDLTPDDLREVNRQRSIQQAMQAGGGNQMGFSGAMMAQALMNRNKPEFDQKQESQLATAKGAQTAMEKWSNQNPDADSYTKGAMYKKFLATAAFQNGLPEVGSDILTKLDAEELARNKQRTELKKLGIETEIADRTKEYEVAKSAIEAGKAAHVEAYLIGSRDPNATLAGIYNPEDGSLRTAQGIIPAGLWKTTRPDRDPALAEGGGRGSRTGAKVGTAEQEKLRASASSVQDLMDKTLDIDNLFLEMYKNGQGPQAAMDVAGRFTGFTDRWVNTATDIAKAFSPTDTPGKLSLVTRDWKGKPETGSLDDPEYRAKYAQKNIDKIKSYLPPNLAKNAEYADRYASMIVDLAYATARAQEPGAKALTDADFNHSMSVIGGKLNDPTSLRKILFSRAMNAARSLDNRFNLYNEDDLNEYVGSKWVDKYKTTRGELDKRLGFERAGDGAEYGTSYPQGTRRPSQPGQAAPGGDTWEIVR